MMFALIHDSDTGACEQDGRTDGRTDGRMDEWMDGWMDEYWIDR